MHQLVQSIYEHGRRLFTQPVHELNQAQRSVRFTIHLVHHCALQLREDRAEEMAAAMSFRTIFGLVPLVVMSLIMFNAFGNLEETRNMLQEQLYDYLNLSAIRVDPDEIQSEETQLAAGETGLHPDAVVLPDDLRVAREALKHGSGSDELAGLLVQPMLATRQPPGVASATQPHTDAQEADGFFRFLAADRTAEQKPDPHAVATSQAKEDLRDTIDKRLNELIEKAYNLDFGGFRIVVLIVLVWAALTLLITVENAFNTVYDCPAGRSMLHRITTYWTLLTLGPVLLLLSLRWTGQFSEWAGQIELLGPIVAWFSQFAALAATWLLMVMLYVWMPATKVHIRPAMIGAFVAAVIWEISKWGFKLYVESAVTYSALYGSLGLIPLFLLWIYLTWLTVLFGLEITHTLQSMSGGEWETSIANAQGREARAASDPRWLLPVAAMIGQSFNRSRPLTVTEMTSRVPLSGRGTRELCDHLEKRGFVFRVVIGNVETLASEQTEAAYVLARPPQQIRLAELLEASYELTQVREARPHDASWNLLQRMLEAERAALGQSTLADHLHHSDDEPPASPLAPTSRSLPLPTTEPVENLA